jgi:hypothetical protein
VKVRNKKHAAQSISSVRYNGRMKKSLIPVVALLSSPMLAYAGVLGGSRPLHQAGPHPVALMLGALAAFCVGWLLWRVWKVGRKALKDPSFYVVFGVGAVFLFVGLGVHDQLGYRFERYIAPPSQALLQHGPRAADVHQAMLSQFGQPTALA